MDVIYNRNSKIQEQTPIDNIGMLWLLLIEKYQIRSYQIYLKLYDKLERKIKGKFEKR